MFSVVIWAAAEGFGGRNGSGSSDIGTAIIYALVLQTLAACTGTDRYSADCYLEQKISWWHKVAEVSHPAQEQPVRAAAVPAQRSTEIPATAVPARHTGSPDPATPLVLATDGAGPEVVSH